MLMLKKQRCMFCMKKRAEIVNKRLGSHRIKFDINLEENEPKSETNLHENTADGDTTKLII
jgi:hypothetical protein